MSLASLSIEALRAHILKSNDISAELSKCNDDILRQLLKKDKQTIKLYYKCLNDYKIISIIFGGREGEGEIPLPNFNIYQDGDRTVFTYGEKEREPYKVAYIEFDFNRLISCNKVDREGSKYCYCLRIHKLVDGQGIRIEQSPLQGDIPKDYKFNRYTPQGADIALKQDLTDHVIYLE